MALRTKNKALQIAVESQAGVPDTTALAAGNKLATDEVSITVAPEFLAADGTKEGLTAVKEDVGKETGSSELKFKLRGTNDGTGIPAWDPALRGAGFTRVVVLNIAGTVANGPFRTREKITQATTGAVAYVIGDTYDGEPQLLVYDASGTADNAEVWTGDSSGATLTPSATPAPEGLGWMPTSLSTLKFKLSAALVSTPAEGSLFQGDDSGARGLFVRTFTDGGAEWVEFEPVRGTFAVDEELKVITAYDTLAGTAFGTTHGTDVEQSFLDFPTISQVVNESGVAIRLVGSRANFSLQMTAGQPAIATISSQGVIDQVSDIPIVAGAVKDNRAAPRWSGAGMGIRNGEAAANMGALEEQAPCLANFSFATGLNLVDRLCASAEGGVEETFAADRKATYSMDPEATLEKDIPWMTRLRSGDLAAFYTTLGTEDGNKFTFKFPGLQATSGTSGDREGILTREISGTLTGGNNYNVTPGGTVGSVGADNEMIIIWHRA